MTLAKLYRKIQQKIRPKTPPPPKDPIQAKVKGKDYLLLGIIVFTMMITLLGWQELDTLNRIMYVLLTFALTLTYVRRQNKLLSDKMKLYIERGSLVAIGLSLLTFIYVLYYRFTG